MVDVFTILFSHAIILVAMWRLLLRDDLDHDDPASLEEQRPWLKGRERAGGASDA